MPESEQKELYVAFQEIIGQTVQQKVRGLSKLKSQTTKSQIGRI